MKILSILNISNTDDLVCDSGVIFQRILLSELIKKNIEIHVLGPDIQAFRDYDIGPVKKHFTQLGTTRYSSRFHFAWHCVESLIVNENPDIIFNNQVEITSAIRAILTSLGNKKTKIVTYCHYPAIWSVEGEIPALDGSLNHNNLGIPIVFDILGALLTSDAFVIQSNFARNLINKTANYYKVQNYKEIQVIPPPADPMVGSTNEKNLMAEKRNVLYNHRLYQTYGTEEFLSFIEDCQQELSFNLHVSDPMPRRSAMRANLNSTPAFYRERIKNLKNAQLIDGNVEREQYKKNILNSKLAIAAFRKACVWSMAAIDCMSLGCPVLAPNYAAYPEFIPEELLFEDFSQAKYIMQLLLNNNDFWLECSKKSQNQALKLSSSIIAEKFYQLFNEL